MVAFGSTRLQRGGMFAKHQSHLAATCEEYVEYLRVDVTHVCLGTDLGHRLVFECLVTEESRNYINKNSLLLHYYSMMCG